MFLCARKGCNTQTCEKIDDMHDLSQISLTCSCFFFLPGPRVFLTLRLDALPVIGSVSTVLWCFHAGSSSELEEFLA